MIRYKYDPDISNRKALRDFDGFTEEYLSAVCAVLGVDPDAKVHTLSAPLPPPPPRNPSAVEPAYLEKRLNRQANTMTDIADRLRAVELHLGNREHYRGEE